MPKVTTKIATVLTALGIDPGLPTAELVHLFSHTDSGKPRNILGSGTKTDKGEKLDVLTFVLYLSASDRAGINTCPWAGECAMACLGFTTGRLVYTQSQKAQVFKTLWFHFDLDGFIARLNHEIARAELQAMAKGMQCAIRLNGASDILWERWVDMGSMPNVQFYDYTKARASTRAHRAPNYHLTFSLDEKQNSMQWAREWLAHGSNVAVVVAGETDTLRDAKLAAASLIGSEWHGYPVLDGDETDVRFYDEPGHWVALYAKGSKALTDRSGFVQRIAN